MTPALDLRLFIPLLGSNIHAIALRAGIPVIGGIFVPFTKCDDLIAYIKQDSVRFTDSMIYVLTTTLKKERAAYLCSINNDNKS